PGLEIKDHVLESRRLLGFQTVQHMGRQLVFLPADEQARIGQGARTLDETPANDILVQNGGSRFDFMHGGFDHGRRHFRMKSFSEALWYWILPPPDPEISLAVSALSPIRANGVFGRLSLRATWSIKKASIFSLAMERAVAAPKSEDASAAGVPDDPAVQTENSRTEVAKTRKRTARPRTMAVFRSFSD